MATKGRRGGQGPVKSAHQVTMPSTSTQASHESASTLQTSKSVNTETSTSSGSRVTSTGKFQHPSLLAIFVMSIRYYICIINW